MEIHELVIEMKLLELIAEIEARLAG